MTTDEIRAYFKAKGVSQREVARFIGVDQRTVRSWFAGDRPPPKLFELAIEADMFDVEMHPIERVQNRLVLKRKRDEPNNN
jgi:transcriptional regulator with XRE-family HTH domain